MNILFQFIELVFISEIFSVETFYSRNGGLTAKYIIDHLRYRISLENTAYFDFKRETWIQNYLKDYS